jgi:hypothetical protein
VPGLEQHRARFAFQSIDARGGADPSSATNRDVHYKGGFAMLWTIAVILLVLWLLGFSLHVAGGLIHILLVVAVIVVLVKLFTGRNVV